VAYRQPSLPLFLLQLLLFLFRLQLLLLRIVHAVKSSTPSDYACANVALLYLFLSLSLYFFLSLSLSLSREVNATSRPGHTELLAIEAAFEARFNAAALANRYDPFLDFATVRKRTPLEKRSRV
jgi:hypothetical protein